VFFLDAYCLGFKETESGIETPYEYLSRRNSEHSTYSQQSNNEVGFPMDIIWGESLTADDGQYQEDDNNDSDSSSGSNSGNNSSGSSRSNSSLNNKKKKKKKIKNHK
jgi:hypothetical protein